MASSLFLTRIETTSNQAFITTSPRLRHMVAASELLARSTTTRLRQRLGSDFEDEVGTAWHAFEGGRARVLTDVSGLALVLTDDSDVSRTIVRAVTRAAIDEAPGLILHGATVELASEDGAGLAEALVRSAGALRASRARTGGGVVAEAMLPFVEPCRTTGRPASALVVVPGGTDGSLGETIAAAELVRRCEADGAALRGEAFRRMADTFGGSVPQHFGDFVERLEKSSSSDGEAKWMAVVHVDGNGIGGLFQRLGERLRGLSLEDAAGLFHRVSTGVDRAARDALGAAGSESRAASGRFEVLPLVVGGDDVTLVCNVESALDLVTAYAREFRDRSAALMREELGADEAGLTVGAGIAYTKPGHPIALGLALAGDLARSAKTAVAGAESVPSAVDLHVLMDAGAGDLERIRAPRASVPDDVDRTGGPWTIGPADPGLADVERFRLLVDGIVARTDLNRTTIQRLRAALHRGRAVFDDAVARADMRDKTTIDRLKLLGLDLSSDAVAEDLLPRASLGDAIALAAIMGGRQDSSAGAVGSREDAE